MKVHGYRRVDGRVGARNHVLVLPSVVCADLVAERIGAVDAVAVVHQHGCGQVGDDVECTERSLLGFATNPNVGAVVVVSLGCETIQGARLAKRLRELGQTVDFAGIQALGGSANAEAYGLAAVARLRRQLDSLERVEVDASEVRFGVRPARGFHDVAERLVEEILHSGASAVVAESWPGAAELSYGERANGRLAALPDAGRGAEQDVALAAAGAQVIVSFVGPGHAPTGFATCPVVAVGLDPEVFAALEDDFDMDGSGDVWSRLIAVFNGELSAAERRGARDFMLRRTARTM
jgi:altronate dehydratase large subunit